MIIPAFLFKADEPGFVQGIRGGLLLSDDHGLTWRTGAVLTEGSDEMAVVETGDNELYISYRMNSRATGQRHFARSRDGGETLCEEGEHSDLACRGLHAGLIRCAAEKQGEPNILLFSNPPGSHVAVSISRDNARSWSKPRPLHDSGKARYSDLAMTADGTVLCLYTTGKIRDSEKISVARFNLAWLAKG